MVEHVDSSLPSNVQKLDREIFEQMNKLRSDPRSFIPYLQEMLAQFDGVLL